MFNIGSLGNLASTVAAFGLGGPAGVGITSLFKTGLVNAGLSEALKLAQGGFSELQSFLGKTLDSSLSGGWVPRPDVNGSYLRNIADTFWLPELGGNQDANQIFGKGVATGRKSGRKFRASFRRILQMATGGLRFRGQLFQSLGQIMGQYLKGAFGSLLSGFGGLLGTQSAGGTGSTGAAASTGATGASSTPTAASSTDGEFTGNVEIDLMVLLQKLNKEYKDKIQEKMKSIKEMKIDPDQKGGPDAQDKQLEMAKLQSMVSARTELFNMVTNMLKSLNDTNLRILGNLRA